MEFEFLAEPPSDYFCPVCTELLTDPYLTDCGHHVCYTCLGRLLENQAVDCPECREHDVLTNARVNRHFQRQVNNLQVRCKHHERGCQWIRELMYLDNHLVMKCEFAVVEFTVTDFTRMKECDAEWVSPPFYSHPVGYQFRLAVYPNGLDAQKGTNLSVCVLSDNPPGKSLSGSFSVTFVNFRGEFPANSSSARFEGEPCTVSSSVTRIRSSSIDWPHSMLAYDSTNNTEYLQNDCVQFKVSLDEDITLIDYPTALLSRIPSWQIPSNQPSLLEFTLPEFSRRVELLHAYHNCPDFYTHENGYKFHFRVSIVGNYISHECVSVQLDLLAGEYDDQLEWPFVGKFVIELLNWREDRNHYEKTFSFGASDGVDRVAEGAYGEEIIRNSFIPYSLLPFDPVYYTEYLYEDCLCFRISLKP